MKAIINVNVYDYLAYYPSSYVIFDEHILEIGPMKKFKNQDLEIIDGKGKLLLPGLINFHTHIYATLIRGLDMGKKADNFWDVLNKIWWQFDQHLSLEDLYESAIRYGEASIKSGVTALIDHNASGEIRGSIDAIRRGIRETLGMKGLFCFETSDRFNVVDCLEENVHAIEKGDGMFGLHASLSLSDETLAQVSKLLGEAPIHMHVAESKIDEEDALYKYKMSVVHRLGRFNLLNKHSILAHCVHIDDEEAELIASSACCVAINPSSNFNNAVGYFNYNRLRQYGINILIGTDGLGTNIAREWQNLYYIGKYSMKNPSGIALDDVRYHIAKSYEIYNELSGSQVGLIKADYAADFVLIDYKAPTIVNEKTIFAHVLYGVFDSFRPSDVFINGKKKLENYLLVEGCAGPYEKIEALWGRVNKK